MKIKLTYVLWAVLFVICGCLGFVQNPVGFGKVLLVLSSLIFFIPGFVLLSWGQRKGVRIVSICSLAVTLVLLMANFLSVLASKLAGDILYGLLVFFSSPMLCSQFWVLSLFLWACLLMSTFLKSKK